MLAVLNLEEEYKRHITWMNTRPLCVHLVNASFVFPLGQSKVMRKSRVWTRAAS